MRLSHVQRRLLVCLAVLLLVATGIPGSAVPRPTAADEPAAAANPAIVPPEESCVSSGGVAVESVTHTVTGAPYRVTVARGEAADPPTPVAYDGARLEIEPAAVTAPVTIGVTPLTVTELPRIGAELSNVTAGPRKGWRFTPHPYRFAEPIEISLPYDPATVAPAFSPQDVYTFYFDDTAGCWKAWSGFGWMNRITW